MHLDLLQAVRAVYEGSLWIPEKALQLYAQFSLTSNRHGVSPSNTLTPREGEVIELVKRRLSNKEIATILKVQESTVKFHLSNAFTKLRIAGRHDLWPQGKTSFKTVEVLV